MTALSLISIFTGCSVGTSFQVIEHNIIVSEFSAGGAQSSALVRGVARNTGPWPVENCGVSVIFYDYQRNTLGAYSSSRERLEPGEDWNFQVELKGQDSWKVARYSLTASAK